MRIDRPNFCCKMILSMFALYISRCSIQKSTIFIYNIPLLQIASPPFSRNINQNHQLNWWFASALKGLITGQRLKTHRMVRQSHYFYRPPLKRPVFLCLGILTTCKRVKVLFHRYLIRCNVFLQLVLYVFSNRLRITAYGIHIVPTTPKMSVPVFVL